MPDVQTRLGWLSFTGEYQPGDPPPSGYNDWHAWAEVQSNAGLEQVTCGQCGKWKFPQELSGRTVTSTPTDSNGNTVTITRPICAKCAPQEGADMATVAISAAIHKV